MKFCGFLFVLLMWPVGIENGFYTVSPLVGHTRGSSVKRKSDDEVEQQEVRV